MKHLTALVVILAGCSARPVEPIYTDMLGNHVSRTGTAGKRIMCHIGPSRHIVWQDWATQWPEGMRKADADRACRAAAAMRW